jgi:hypothetical protein
MSSRPHLPARWFRLSVKRDPQGISCDDTGAFAGPVPLLTRNLGAWRPRPLSDINADLAAIYGVSIEFKSKISGLVVVARALDRRNVPLAQVAMLQLHLPDPPDLRKSAQSDRLARTIVELYGSQLLSTDWAEKVRRFDPNLHPRWPAGDKEHRGGQFRLKDDDFFLPVGDRHDDDENLPANRKPTPSELNRYARRQSAIQANQVRTGIKTKAQAIGEFLDRVGVSDEIGKIFSRFLSRFDSPVSLEELIKQTQTDRARSLPGYETHHIVERGPNEGEFSEEQLEGPENVVRIPYYKHRDISDLYSTKNDSLGGLTPREYLRGKSFEEQRQFGIDTLKKFEVIK